MAIRRVRNFRRRRGIRRRRGNTGRGTSRPGMVLYKSFQQMPFPRVFQTKFKTIVQGYIKAGVDASNATLQFKLNSPYLPFDQGAATGLANTTYYAGVAPNNRTVQPAGWSSLMNANLYNNYRVIGCKIRITMNNQALGDNGLVCTIIPTFLTTPANVGVALSQPYCKKMLLSEAKTNILSNYMTQHKLLGIQKRAIEFDLSGKYFGFYNAAPGAPMYWAIIFSNNDGSVTTSPVPFEIELTHYTKCWTANTGGLIET